MTGVLQIRFLLVLAGLGGLLYGIDFGAIAAAMPYIRELKMFTDAELSGIVGAVLLGGIVSSCTAGFLCERFGRKTMIVASSVLFLLAIPIVCLSGGVFSVMFAGRVLQGMSAGYMSVAMPLYLTEMLPPEIRGRGTGAFQLFLSIGLVLAAVAGFCVTTFLGTDADLAWKVNFWWTMLPVGVLFFGSLRLEESTVWKRGVPKAGCASAKAGTLLQRRYVVPFLLAVAVLTLNKTTGMSSVTSYSVAIFQKSGLEGVLGNTGDVVLKGVNLLVTCFATMLIDRKGRTFLLKAGTAGMTFGLLAIGGVFFAIEHLGVAASAVTGWSCLAAFVIMQVFYSLGPGICVWLVLSELMPHRIRANGMSVALFMNQFVAWGLASSFLPWVNRWGWCSMFFFFAGNAVVYFLVALLIPETGGKTLEELENLFEKTVKPENRSYQSS